MPYEADLIPIVCALLAGTGTPATEVRHGYSAAYDLHVTRVDCETAELAVEVGLDKRSSIDSLHQALFAAHLTGKAPMIVIVDTDGREGPWEYQVRTVAAATGVAYRSYPVNALIRWQMTGYFRDRVPVPAAF